MSTTPGLVCEQDGCPFADNGRCLEGLPNGEGCPHLRSLAADEDAAAAPPGNGEPQPGGEIADAGVDTSELDPTVELGGEDSVTLAAGDAIAARFGATVVLIAGEHNAGKTTLLAELYAQFLKGPFASWSYAGSECLIALDRRYQGARGVGPGPPEIEHTADEEMRLIDLRLLSASGRRVSLLLSDIKGEFVRQVIDGAPLREELPLAVRADRTAVLIDGEKIASMYTRQEAVTRARVLIGALTDPGGVPDGRPLAVILAKKDKVDSEGLDWFTAEADQLRAFAEERGARGTTVNTAARPDNAPHRPEGLDDFLAWVVAPAPEAETLVLTTALLGRERSFWRLHERPYE